ncbi:kinase-like domain-containing protein [Hypoxylon sp. FL1857]|nr:kinase-like domain-containing protein [Hypoxylon sp. FL1857]
MVKMSQYMTTTYCKSGAKGQFDPPAVLRYRRPNNRYSPEYEQNGMTLEDFEMYRPGGYHPVHIGDVLDEQYEVVHKLGSGGYGTVWLCFDKVSRCWKSVKIIVAHYSNGSCPELEFTEILNDSKFVEAPEKYFWIDGPNGKHLALVLPVLGPPIWMLPCLTSDPATLRNACRQVALALRDIHSNGILHNDFRTSNILLRMHSIDSLTKEQLWELLGAPTSAEYNEPIVTVNRDDPRPHAPRYAVRSVDLRRLQDWIIGDEIAVIDFGLATKVSCPRRGFAVPPGYAAPELLISRDLYSQSSDVWTFAHSILEIYTGNAPWGDNSFNAIGCMERFLGPLPEKYRQDYAENHPPPSPTANKGELEHDNVEGGSGDGYDDDEDDYDYDYDDPYDFAWPRMPIDPKLEGNYLHWKPKELQAEREEMQKKTGYVDILNGALSGDKSVGGFGAVKKRTYHLPRHELLQLSDLLRRMFRYEPEKRLSPEEVLDHPWFARSDPTSQLEAGQDTSLPQNVNDGVKELMDLVRDTAKGTSKQQCDVARILATAKDGLAALKRQA